MTAKVTSEIVDLSPPAEWFDRWWGPAEFGATVNVQKQRFQYFEEMLRPPLRPLREAWVASRLAMVLSQDRPVSIRLEADRFPDFTLRIREEILPFELTEACQEGRRRDEEYRRAAVRKAEGLAPVIEQFDPNEEENAAIPAIACAIEKKAKKRYSSPPHLLVYVNFFSIGHKPPITNLLAFQLADLWRKDFKSCWLLWDRCTFRLWPNAARIRSITSAEGGSTEFYVPSLAGCLSTSSTCSRVTPGNQSGKSSIRAPP